MSLRAKTSPRLQKARLLASLAFTILLSSCNATRLPASTWQGLLLSHDSPADFPSSLDEDYFDGPLRCGSSITYRITRAQEGQATEEWLVTVEAPLAPEPTQARFKLKSFQGAGQTGNSSARIFEGKLTIRHQDEDLGSDIALLPLGYLRAGLGSSCDLIQSLTSDHIPTDEEVKQLSLGPGAGVSLSMVVNQSSGAQSIAVQLIQLPSLWSWLIPGISVSLKPDFENSQRLPFGDHDAWTIPTEVLVKGDSAFLASITTVNPKGVLEMTAGIVCIVGFAPDRPDDIVRVEIVDASFGSSGKPGAPITSQIKWE